MREWTVRLPNSSVRRNRPGHLKLLRRVRENASSGVDFEGITLQPGAAVPVSTLYPPDFPSVPIVLEHAQTHFSGRGHNRNPSTFLLWEYSAVQAKWIELCSCIAYGLEWTLVLGPMAREALRDTWKPKDRPDLRAIARQLAAGIDDELSRLEPDEQRRVLDHLYTYCAIRVANGTACQLALFEEEPKPLKSVGG